MKKILTRQQAASVMAEIEQCRARGEFVSTNVGGVAVAESFDGEFVLAHGGASEAHRSAEDFALAYGLSGAADQAGVARRPGEVLGQE